MELSKKEHLTLNELREDLHIYLQTHLSQKTTDSFLFRNYVTVLTLRRLMAYIYGAPILDVSRSHTTTQHSR